MPMLSAYPILILTILAMAFGGTGLIAQEVPTSHVRHHHVRSVAEALTAWRDGADTGETAIRKILRNPGGYTAATVDSALDGTANLAVAAEEPAVRHAAVSVLVSAGSTIYANSPRPDVVQRARAIYESSRDPVVRGIIVARMADQAEDREAITFLKEVVVEGDELTDGFDGSTVHTAIDALNRMGAAGQEALRQAYATGRMGSAAVGYLEYLGVIP